MGSDGFWSRMAKIVRGNGRRADDRRRNSGDAGADVTVEGLESRRLFAVTFNITFDPSLTSASAKAAFNYAAADLSSKLPTSRNVTVNLEVGAVSNGTPGQTTQSLFSVPFTTLRTQLLAANPSLLFASSDPIFGAHQWVIDSAEAKMLGISVPPPTHDADINFGTNLPWNFSTTNRAISNEYDFVGVAEHEISEALGRIAGVGQIFSGSSVPNYTPLDLFRVNSSDGGATWYHSYSGSAGGFFSADNGAHHSLKDYNTNSSGDYGDWAFVGIFYPESCDATASPGWQLTFTSSDISEMNALGYV